MSQHAPSVLITGAAGGVGRATARRFAQEGYRIILADLFQPAIDSFADQLKSEFPEVELLPLLMDQSSVESVQSAVEAVKEWAGELNILALIAGTVQQDSTRVVDLDIEEWDRVHSVNLRGVFISAKYFIPIIPRDGSGSVVAIASYFGRNGFPLYASYCTSKAGVISIIQTLAHECAEWSIRANAIAPGSINTPMHVKALEDEAAARGVTFEEMRDEYWSRIPLQKAADPSQIADAVYFLSSDQASYITGVTLDVNGGVMMS